MNRLGRKKIIAVLLVFIMAVTSVLSNSEGVAAASAKVTLSKNKLNITAGKKKTVTIKKKNVKKIKSVKWKTNKKSVLTVSGNKSKATITAKKAGKAQITCTIKYVPKGKKAAVKKQVILKVTVTEKKKPSATQKPSTTSNPSAVPNPTDSPSAAPPSATALPTETPSGDNAGGSYVPSGDQTYFVEDKTLNNGYTMPVLGIGTYALTVDEAENSVYHALKDGYRLVDTASAYYNEEGVGRGIKRAIEEGLVKREDIFVTTKVWDTDFGNARASLDQSLSKLGLEYVDLVLLHHIPRANDESAYHELEAAVREGKIRSLGLSNIYLNNAEFDRMYNAAEIKPVLVQNENHPFFQNTDFQEYVSQWGLFIESWYPLGGRGFTQRYFTDETLLGIAAAHNKTVAQVLLRWHLQAGYITIPGSSNPDHIAENYDIFDFQLTDEEMQTMKEMDTGHGNFNLRE